jgi:hypothetical protein
MKKSKLLMILLVIILVGCADSKQFNINGKDVVVEPYGWADEEAMKNDSVIYQINGGNVVLDIIFIETIFVPIWLTGYQLYEPVKKVNE